MARERPRTVEAAVHRELLFFSAAVLSSVILLVAGLVLSTIYRRTAEANFDERLGVYLHELVADIATPGEDSRTGPGQSASRNSNWPYLAGIGKSRGWTCPSQRSKFALHSRQSFRVRPMPARRPVPAALAEATRQGRMTGVLRMLERVIDTGDQGIYLVQVAATTEQIDAQISRFEFHFVITFAVLVMALVVGGGAASLWLETASAVAGRGRRDKTR